MARKYAKDYRIETRLNASGRQEMYAVYEGEYYWFSCPEAELKTLKIWYAVCSALSCVLLAVLLFSSGRYDRNFRYAVLPEVLSVLPLYFVLTSAAILCWAREPLVLKNRDKICKTLPGAALFQAILSVLCLAGQVLYPVFYGWDTPAILLIVCAVIFSAASWLMVARRGRLNMEVVPAPKK